jgi:hypothetical protein
VARLAEHAGRDRVGVAGQFDDLGRVGHGYARRGQVADQGRAGSPVLGGGVPVGEIRVSDEVRAVPR